MAIPLQPGVITNYSGAESPQAGRPYLFCQAGSVAPAPPTLPRDSAAGSPAAAAAEPKDGEQQASSWRRRVAATSEGQQQAAPRLRPLTPSPRPLASSRAKSKAAAHVAALLQPTRHHCTLLVQSPRASPAVMGLIRILSLAGGATSGRQVLRPATLDETNPG